MPEAVATVWQRRHWRALLFAGRFLTRTPLPDPGAPAPGELGRAALYYPLVGLLLGAVLALLGALMVWLLPNPAPLAIAAVLLIGWVWGTGALHLDGLGDCADAWVGGLGSRERTFAILKDPRSGAMAVVALVLILIARFAALAALVQALAGAALPMGLGSANNGGGASAGWLALAWLPALARAQVLLLALTTSYARPTGMGAALRDELRRPAAWLVVAATWTGALLTLWLVAGSAGGTGLVAGLASGLMLALAAALVFVAWRRSMVTRLGGFTGDTAGALVELTETALLLVLVFGLGQPTLP